MIDKKQQWIRTCPICKGKIIYIIYRTWWRANKLNRKCNNCQSEIRKKTQFRKGEVSDRLLKFYSNEEERIRIQKLTKEAMHRPDVRKKHLDALHQSKWIKVKTDKGQLELIEKWNRLGFNFQPNYQLKTDVDLFYVDGYDKEKNVVLEYDSKYHKRQEEKDLVRQEKIIDILKPKRFWRYDVVNKQFRNVLN